MTANITILLSLLFILSNGYKISLLCDEKIYEYNLSEIHEERLMKELSFVVKKCYLMMYTKVSQSEPVINEYDADIYISTADDSIVIDYTYQLTILLLIPLMIICSTRRKEKIIIINSEFKYCDTCVDCKYNKPIIEDQLSKESVLR